MLQQNNPGDYVLTTNETHSVKEFAYEPCKIVQISWDAVTSGKILMY